MAKGRRFTRKQAIVAGGVAAAAAGGGAAAVILTRDGDEGGEAAAGEYPRLAVATLGEIQPGKPVSFEYPLTGQQSVLVDLDQEVPQGVGDKRSIVAYSILCQHMGCPVQYVQDGAYFLCPCHQSKYDPAREGFVIQGVAMTPLPQIQLEVEGEDIVAVGISGLIYGYRENLAPGEKVA
jgi:arsenite oxidase small subunit